MGRTLVAAAFAFAITASSVGALVFAGTAPAYAKKIKCKSSEFSVTDERDPSGNLCLKKSEWRKAIKICAQGAIDKPIEPGETINPMNCICQNGDSVGACGD